MTGKELWERVLIKAVTEGGVEQVCIDAGVRRSTVERAKEGKTTPDPATVRKLFALAAVDGVRPPYFDFPKTGRFIDPETSDALLQRIATLEAQLHDARATPRSAGSNARDRATRRKKRRDGNPAPRRLLPARKYKVAKARATVRTPSPKPTKTKPAKPKPKPKPKLKPHRPAHRKSVPAIFRKPAAPPAQRTKKRN